MTPTPKKALICGISGQDGSYLAKSLLDQGLEVWGTSRDAGLATFDNLRRLRVLSRVQVQSLDLRDVSSILNVLRRFRPNEIYSVAGQTSVGLSFEQPVQTIESISIATLNLLEAIRLSDTDIRLYNAGSSEIFGDTGEFTATEESPFRPRSPYAVAKTSALWTVANYREAYHMFACTGILSNHESPIRPYRFVTRKVINAVARIMLGEQVNLRLGNLNIERDWGWAPEYVDAIIRMLRQSTPEDILIATGKTYPLRMFVETAFSLANREWQDHVTIDDTLIRPSEITRSQLDPSKAESQLGWRAKSSMTQVVEMMLDAELELLSSEQRQVAVANT